MMMPQFMYHPPPGAGPPPSQLQHYGLPPPSAAVGAPSYQQQQQHQAAWNPPIPGNDMNPQLGMYPPPLDQHRHQVPPSAMDQHHQAYPPFPPMNMPPSAQYQDARFPDRQYAGMMPPGGKAANRAQVLAAAPPPARVARQAPPPRSRSNRSSPPPAIQAIQTPEAMKGAVEHLAKMDKQLAARSPDALILVTGEDKVLLTDYFYYLMKQLQVCRFGEEDRKTRGGKREKIAIGYGGLQCIHCTQYSNARKFYWSNVDRLANSFAEIPSHILKCRGCPESTREALYTLKSFHSEQMTRLPRGSQKVFFRRMWRRLHEEDGPGALSPTSTSPGRQNVDTSNVEKSGLVLESKLGMTTPAKEHNSPHVSEEGSPRTPEKTVAPIRPSAEAARLLAAANTSGSAPDMPPSARILLAVPEDKEWLSDLDCFTRKQIEVFCATEDDVSESMTEPSTRPALVVGQVGIRCIHCSTTYEASHLTDPLSTAVVYPTSLQGIYEAAKDFQRLHFDQCENVPEDVKRKLQSCESTTSLSSILRKYYISAAKAMGLHDGYNRIHAGAPPEPVHKSSGSIDGVEADTSNLSPPEIQPESTGMNMKKRKSPRLDSSSDGGSDGSPTKVFKVATQQAAI